MKETILLRECLGHATLRLEMSRRPGQKELELACMCDIYTLSVSSSYARVLAHTSSIPVPTFFPIFYTERLLRNGRGRLDHHDEVEYGRSLSKVPNKIGSLL